MHTDAESGKFGEFLIAGLGCLGEESGKTKFRNPGRNEESIKVKKLYEALMNFNFHGLHDHKGENPFASPLSLFCTAWCFPGLVNNNNIENDSN